MTVEVRKDYQFIFLYKQQRTEYIIASLTQDKANEIGNIIYEAFSSSNGKGVIKLPSDDGYIHFVKLSDVQHVCIRELGDTE